MNYNITISDLHDKGFRITDIRKSVIEVFSKTAKPLSINSIEKEVKKLGTDANIATIYREIDFLNKNNLVNKIYFSTKRSYYESSELKHHHHLICQKCGSIAEVTNCLLKDLNKKVLKEKGFRIKKHNLEFFGLCKNCSSKN